MKDFLDVTNYKLILVDAMNLVFRTHFGMKQLSWHGKKTGMLYGVASFIFRMQKLHPNAQLLFLWEGTKSRRKVLHEGYKSNRSRQDNSFMSCVKEVRAFVHNAGIDMVSHLGLEADDLAGYLCATAEAGERILLVSNDEDWYQFMRPDQIDIHVNGRIETFAEIQKSLGFPPDKIGMWKILKGDKSDGLKGIVRIPSVLVRLLINKSLTYKNFKGYPLQTHNKSWAKWEDEIRENWETVIERNATLILYQPDWIEPNQIVVESGEYDEAIVIQTLEDNGIKSLIEEVKSVRHH